MIGMVRSYLSPTLPSPPTLNLLPQMGTFECGSHGNQLSLRSLQLHWIPQHIRTIKANIYMLCRLKG
uniref:Putative ovule protein n=1 Tax=Solanum chacoense TaxID=4108 RepID=A0A0V0IIR5_SOLCH